MQGTVDEVVERANALLPRVGQEGFKDVEELKRLACSMFVYLFESLFHTLEGIERRPRFKAEYAFNADQVIQALSDIVGADLSYISGSEIADGNIDHIAALLAEFEEYLALEDRENAELGYPYEEEEEDVNQGREFYNEDVEYGGGRLREGEDTFYNDEEEEEIARGGDFLKEAISYDHHEEDDYLSDDFDTRRPSDFYEVEGEDDEEEGYEEDDYFNSEDDYYCESTDGYQDLSEDIGASDRDFGIYSRTSNSRRREESLPSITKRRSTSFQTTSPRDRPKPTEYGFAPRRHVTTRTTGSRLVPSIPSSPSLSSSASSLGVSENYLDEMISRFPAEEMRRKKQFSALRKLARHRTDDSARESEYSVKLNAQKQRDKGRFKKAYESILEQERTEDRIRAQRRRLMDQLERRRRTHEEKVERIRMQRLADQLAREAEARRLRRKAREDALVKRMFDEALATEKERILHTNKLASEERARQDAEALKKYEVARQIYEDQKEMLETERLEKERAEKQQRRLQQEEVRRLSKELKQDFDRKLQDARLALDAREERIFYVNSQVIEKAFAALSDTRNSLYSAQATAFG